eukprot:g2845.t1
MERSVGSKDDVETNASRYLPRTARNRRHQEKSTPQKWVQCTFCKKWRQVPYHLKDSDLGDRWVCKDNIWDPMFAACTVPQALSNEEIDARLKAFHEEVVMEAPSESRDPSQSFEFANSTQFAFEARKQPTAFFRTNTSRSMDNFRHHKFDRNRRNSPQSIPMKREEKIQTGDLNDVAETLLKLASNANSGNPVTSRTTPFSSGTPHEGLNFVPGDLVWGKVEGHDWWPAKVVRRRSVPAEVGPPPGGASEVMYYIPVVFFTPTGIPKEVELPMDSYQFPITLCQRANGLVDEDEAEFAWLSADNIRPFCNGDTNGKKDGSEVNDEQLQSCIDAAHLALMTPDSQLHYWKDNEDSDGGWCCAAAFSRNRQQQKHKKTTRKKSKRLDDIGSDNDSGVDGGPELLVLGNFMLTPRISVEQIYAWRRPLSCEQKTKELEKEQDENKQNLQKLNLLSEKLQNQEPISSSIFESWENQKDAELTNKDSTSITKDTELIQQEREALSALLGLGPLPQTDSEPVLSSLDEVEYFVKYANRSHTHNEWVNESTLMKIAKRKLTHFKKKFSDRPINMFNEDWMKPERIISRRKSKTGPGWELLIKWTDTGMEECTWETEGPRILTRPETVLLYIELWKRQTNAMRRNSLSFREKANEAKTRVRQNFKPVENPLQWLQSHQLHSHQLETLNWCRSCWLNARGGFIRGELGQGRTATVVALLQCLREELHCINPFLLVVSSSHLEKWNSEIQFWSNGKIDTVIYQGPHSSKPVYLEHEIWQSMECLDGRFPARDNHRNPKADVVLMSSELLAMELESLLEVPWDVVVLDLRWISRLNIDRITNLMTQIHCPCFISASKLPSSESSLLSILKLINSKDSSHLESMYNDEEFSKDENRLMEQLHRHLMKNCFEIQTPKKPIPHQSYKEWYIPLSFTTKQQDQYKECLIRHYDTLRDEGVHRYSSPNIMTLKNIVEDLSLVCQHPMLLEEEEDWDITGLDALVASSGKLEVLGNLLEVLKSTQINTLLLTHTQRCYELLVKYLNLKFGIEAYQSMSVMDSTAQQHSAIHNFNSSSSFLFLTTGESCGLGMELSKINCVVIFESAAKSDDNLVALWRAFQIGNVTELPVFHFFIAGSVEERMMQTIKRSDSKGNSYDMKVLEDVLIWGTQSLFDDVHGVQRHPYFTGNSPKTASIAMTLTYCKALVQYVFNVPGSDASMSRDLPPIRWKAKNKEDIAKEIDGHDLSDTVRHINDPLLIAGYWEQLLQSDWSNRRLNEDIKHSGKQEDTRQNCSVEMECEFGSDGDLVEDVEQTEESMKQRMSSRRKRYAQGSEAHTQGIPRGQKKQRSTHKSPQGALILLEESSNDENKWSKEALLSSKAHQDVLAQIITDPNTLEGKAVQEACIRIDSVAKELSLPVNIIKMANHVVEILLTLREDRDQGSYFQDYTLLAIICFACYLGGFHLGENYGLKDLSAKYSQDQETMEQIFKYIAKAMWDYKQMLLKIQEVSDQKQEDTGGTVIPIEPRTKKQTTVAQLQQPIASKMEAASSSAHSLHRDLDGFLLSLNETLKKEKEFEFEKFSEILAQPPGAPIKGHTPQQWFPLPFTSETVHLKEQARRCDAEMYHVEKSFETKWHKIEKAYLTFQERVRDHGVKALERLKYDTMMSQKDVDNRRQQLKQVLEQNQTQGTTPNTLSNLLAAFQQTQHWSHGQEQKEDPGRMLAPTGVLGSRDHHHTLHSVQPAARLDLNPSNQRSIDQIDPLTGSTDHVMNQWKPPTMTQSTGTLSLNQLLMRVSSVPLGNDKPLKLINKQPSQQQQQQNPTISRVMQYSAISGQTPSSSLNKGNRPFNQSMRPVSHSGFPRLSPEDNTKTSITQHSSRFQGLSLTPNQKVMSQGNIRALPPSTQIQVTGSYGLISSVIPNYTNVCVFPARLPPHPTVPGITQFTAQTTSEDNANNTRSSQSLVRSPNAALDGLSFLQERAKSIQEAPSVRMEPTPAVKVVISQPSNVVSSNQKGSGIPCTKSTPPMDPMVENYSTMGSMGIEESTMHHTKSHPSSLMVNPTITTGVGRPPDSISSRQHTTVDFMRPTSTPVPRLPHHEGSPVNKLIAAPNQESVSSEDQPCRDSKTRTNQGVGPLGRPRMETGSNTGTLHDQSTVELNQAQCTSSQCTEPSTGVMTSESAGMIKSNSGEDSQSEILKSKEELLGTSVFVQGSEPSIQMGSLNSALTAVSSVETRSSQLLEATVIQKSDLDHSNDHEMEPTANPVNPIPDQKLEDE